jgi:hypothetical protein
MTACTQNITRSRTRAIYYSRPSIHFISIMRAVGSVILYHYYMLSSGCSAFSMASIVAHAEPSNPRIWRHTSNSHQLELSSMPSDSANDFSSILLSHESMTAEDVVTTCMDALQQNDNPSENTGLKVCFNLSSDRCRAALGGNLDDFISYANNPTFGTMINAKDFVVLSVGPVIPATKTRGAMQTVLIKVKPSSGNDRGFLW